MKVVIQRVLSASVTVGDRCISEIKNGFLVLVGLCGDDTPDKFDKLITKIMKLRVFSDDDGKMNTSLVDNKYEVLLVSQFTLYADCRKGNRPSFVNAMPPDKARVAYRQFVEQFKKLYYPALVFDGEFGAMMEVALVNDGPVTIVLEG